MKRNTRLLYGAAAVVPLALAVSAMGQSYSQPGDYTETSDPFAGEASHEQIMQQIYGGTANAQNGNDLGSTDSEYVVSGSTYGELTISRVTDNSGGNSLDLHGYDGDMDDQFWSDGLTTVKAEAKYAAHSGTFGWRDDTSGGTFSDIFSVSGGVQPNPGQSWTGTLTSDFRWEYQVDNTGKNLSSEQGENDNGQDQMITYHVEQTNQGTGELLNGGRPVFLLFWEDQVQGDWDYNDLVIELSVIPLPAPVAMGLLGLGGLVAFRRRLMK